jgi:hypothetical protein
MDLVRYTVALANARHEQEAQAYAREYGCSIEKARYDVDGEYNATPTATDAFYDRMEGRA